MRGSLFFLLLFPALLAIELLVDDAQNYCFVIHAQKDQEIKLKVTYEAKDSSSFLFSLHDQNRKMIKLKQDRTKKKFKASAQAKMDGSYSFCVISKDKKQKPAFVSYQVGDISSEEPFEKQVSKKSELGNVIKNIQMVEQRMENLQYDLESATQSHKMLHQSLDHRLERIKTMQYRKTYFIILLMLAQAFLIQSMVKQNSSVMCV